MESVLEDTCEKPPRALNCTPVRGPILPSVHAGSGPVEGDVLTLSRFVQGPPKLLGAKSKL